MITYFSKLRVTHRIIPAMSAPSWASIAEISCQSATASTGANLSITTATPPKHQKTHQSANLSSTTNAKSQQNEHYRPRAFQRDREYVYVLTLLLTPGHQDEMSALRKKWFPKKLQKVDAHITLFHALPESKLEEIKADITEITQRTRGFEVRADQGGVFKMGKGVGVEIDRAALDKARDLRESLRARWQGEDGEMRVVGLDDRKSSSHERETGWLSEQDARKGWKGHYTVMNKEDDRERKEQCYRELTHGWQGSKGMATGLSLWRYDRGWWRKTEDFKFV